MTTADFPKIEEKCRTKLLSGRKLEVHRVPVSNCILVDNLSPKSSDDDVAYYFENQRGCIGTVLQVRSCKNQSKYVFFRDPEGNESLLHLNLITMLMLYLIIFRRYAS